MRNYLVLEKEKEMGCSSATIRTILKSLFFAKSSGRLKTKHLEHFYVMAKIVICQFCMCASSGLLEASNAFKSLLCISKETDNGGGGFLL